MSNSRPLSLLVIDDSPADVKLIARELRRAGLQARIEHVDSPEGMRAALDERRFDAILSDWSMPRFSGLSALALMHERNLDVPFIIVSGTIGEEVAVEAMRSGAHDYVLKDRLARLAPALERELRECERRAAQRRAVEALRASEARFSRLAESGIVGIAITDATGKILEANAACLTMLGYEAAELGDKQGPVPALLPVAGSEPVFSGVAHPRERELLRKNGERLPALLAGASLEADRCIYLISDLRPQKVVEEALRKSEEQLRQAQKMEAMGRLAGGIAHDFNNLLSVILGQSELLLEALLAGDPMREEIEAINGAGKRAAELTRQLLLFSRQQELEPRVLDLNEIVTAMSSMLRRVLGEDIQYRFSAHCEPCKVLADRGSLEQVIMNLVVNARDAMPTGGTLTIETSRLVLDDEYARAHLGVVPGPHVMLAVSDTGTGMDRETQSHLFEPFFTTKERGKGTGLGLSTVFGIVQRSHGSIWVYSEVNLGTTFKIYLPSVEHELDVAAPPTPRVRLEGTETILMVEDDDSVRAVACEILRRLGYRVLEARSAAEALLQGQEHEGRIHLLVTDVVMPHMSGPELAARLRETRPDLKVLCMSGYTDENVVRHGVHEGQLAFLQKPLTPSLLARKVRDVLAADDPQPSGADELEP
jgi:hypothetical protein